MRARAPPRMEADRGVDTFARSSCEGWQPAVRNRASDCLGRFRRHHRWDPHPFADLSSYDHRITLLRSDVAWQHAPPANPSFPARPILGCVGSMWQYRPFWLPAVPFRRVWPDAARKSGGARLPAPHRLWPASPVSTPRSAVLRGSPGSTLDQLSASAYATFDRPPCRRACASMSIRITLQGATRAEPSSGPPFPFDGARAICPAETIGAVAPRLRRRSQVPATGPPRRARSAGARMPASTAGDPATPARRRCCRPQQPHRRRTCRLPL